MSFAPDILRAAIAAHGPVARAVVARSGGSAPREPGAAMLVWPGGQSGTIGGGALEWQVAERARAALADGRDMAIDLPLGPALGQCCGGHVSVLIEIWDPARLDGVTGPLFARPLPGQAGDMPLAVRRQIARARDRGRRAAPGVTSGWMVEPVDPAPREIWIWGAGHVGRAMAAVLAPLPEVAVTLIDDAPARFPGTASPGVRHLLAADMPAAVAQAPDGAEHYVLTYSHAIDLELCHRILQRRFGRLGLIGSATKRARFLKRLAGLGHPPERLARLDCPIGDPALGKHPQAIAIGVAAEVLKSRQSRMSWERKTG